MKTNTLKKLRIFSLWEGVSVLLLFGVCMPLKYMLHFPFAEDLTRIVGMAHGILFIIYCVLVLVVQYERKWKLIITLLALAASLFPFGTFVADAKIFKKEPEEIE